MPDMTPPVTYQLQRADMDALWDELRKRRGKSRRSPAVVLFDVAFYAALTLINLAILAHDVRDPQTSATTVAVFGVIVGAAGCLWVLYTVAALKAPRQRRGHFEGLMAARGPQRLRGNEAELEATLAGVVSTFPWSSFIDFARTPSHFFLLVAKGEAIVVPRAAVAGTPLGDLIARRVAHGVIAPGNPLPARDG